MTTQVSPTRIDHPVHVLEEKATTVECRADGAEQKIAVRQYELEVPYLNMGRRARAGKARLFIPQGAAEPMALIVSMHYELSLDGAAEHLAQGWAVMTPREALNPFGDGVNFNVALLQACRQMPFVDKQRVGLLGASAGGYVTLMVASDAFPVTAAAAIAPIVSVPYEVAYFANNIGPAQCVAKDEQGKSAARVPIFCLVAEAVKGFAAFLGPLEDGWRSWLRDSPVGVMSLVTCPVIATFSTADVLVPINQVSNRFVTPTARGIFPEGFEFAHRALVGVPGGRRTFMQAAGRRAHVFLRKVPDNVPPSWEGSKPGNAPPAHEMTCVFSTRQPLSVVIIDEGAPDPRIGHFKYRFRYSMVPFFRHWFGRKTPIAAEQLTLRKLEQLMRRLQCEDFERLMGFDTPGEEPVLLTRRNRAGWEKADVIAGLRAYCESGPAHRERLRRVYRQLPASLRALDAGPARFDADVVGGLAYHEAVLQYRWGDRARARHLAGALLRQPAHRAYSSCLPLTLVRMANGDPPTR